eukprot:m.90710 g.90710  ORF g.90710 m.90710 type:complete len:1042 (-) comp15016_c1_seq2:96-3221(-)
MADEPPIQESPIPGSPAGRSPGPVESPRSPTSRSSRLDGRTASGTSVGSFAVKPGVIERSGSFSQMGSVAEERGSGYDAAGNANTGSGFLHCCCFVPIAVLRALFYVKYYEELLRSEGVSDRVLYDKLARFFSLVGVVGAFFAAVSHVGFVEEPQPAGLLGGNDRAWWFKGYAVSFFAAVMCSLACSFVALMLLVLIAHAPPNKIRRFVGKVKWLISGPVHLLFAGFVGITIALVFLTRITYGDTEVVWKLAACGLALCLLVLLGFTLYVGLREHTMEGTNHEQPHPGCFRRVLGFFTVARYHQKMIASGIDEEHAFGRFTTMWTTVSLVASIIGGCSFEALWLRPNAADPLVNTTGDSRTIHATAFYASLALNMYAVLNATLMMVMSVFFASKQGMHKLLYRVVYVVNFPMVFLCLGWCAFATGVPFFAQGIYGSESSSWKVSLMAAGFCGLLFIIVSVYRFAYSGSNTVSPTGEPAPPPRGGFTHSIFNWLTLSDQLERMVNSELPEDRLYTRMAQLWSVTAITSALLVFVCTVTLQTFAQYPNSEDHIPVFAASVCLGLFFCLMSVFISVAFQHFMVTVPHGSLREWLGSKSNFVFLPVICLGLCVASLAVGLAVAALAIYSNYLFIIGVSLGGGTMVVMGLLRLAASKAVPSKEASDSELSTIRDESFRKRTLLSWFTRADLFSLLIDSSIDEAELFDRLQSLLDGVTLVAALLTLLSLDAFREDPTYNDVTKKSDGSGAELDGYATAALAALTANVVTLLMGTYYNYMLCLVPANAVRKFLHNMRHLMFLPVLALMAGVGFSFLTWWFQAEITYNKDSVVWPVRGVLLFAGGTIVLLFFYVSKRTGHISRFEQEQELGRLKDCFDLLMCCVRKERSSGTGFSNEELYSRRESLWKFMATVGALVSALSFLGYQNGLEVGAEFGIVPSNIALRIYVLSQLISLCFNTAATYLCVFFLAILTFIPHSGMSRFVKQVHSVTVLPHLFLMAGTVSFLVGVPLLGRSLYGETVFVVCAAMAWGLAFLGSCVAIFLAVQARR